MRRLKLLRRGAEKLWTSYGRVERLFRRSLSQTSSKYTNIQTVVSDTVLSQVMNDVTGVINHDSKVTRVNNNPSQSARIGFVFGFENRFSVRM